MERWRIMAALWLLALAGVWSACGGHQTSIFSKEFQVCSKSDNWVPPSIDQQRAEIWSLPRHQNDDEAALTQIFNEPVFPWEGGNSELFDSYPLHGLWTATDAKTEQRCADPPDVYSGRYVDLYLLNHRALHVTLGGNTYTVLVEPTQRGFQHIEFSNRLYQEKKAVPFRVVVRTMAGNILHSFDDCAPRNKGLSCG